MSNFEIDPNTGLPKLPEGLYWRVQEFYISIVREDTWDDWALNERCQCEDISYDGPQCGPRMDGWSWFFREPRRDEVGREALGPEARYVTAPGGGYKHEVRRGYSETVAVNTYTTLLVGETTRDNVIERCESLLDKYLREAEIQEMKDKLYGDYPPKKLEE